MDFRFLLPVGTRLHTSSLFIPSTNLGNYLSFCHWIDFSLSNFYSTFKITPSTLGRFIIVCKRMAIIFPSQQETYCIKAVSFDQKRYKPFCIFGTMSSMYLLYIFNLQYCSSATLCINSKYSISSAYFIFHKNKFMNEFHMKIENK